MLSWIFGHHHTLHLEASSLFLMQQLMPLLVSLMTTSTTHFPLSLQFHQLQNPPKMEVGRHQNLQRILLNKHLKLQAVVQDPKKLQKTIFQTPHHMTTPLKSPNIWCDIMKLEGRKHSNLVADVFVNWLRKTIDSTLHEVLIKHFISH